MPRPEFKWSRTFYKARRAAVRVLVRPAHNWDQGPRKERLQRRVLRGQNSLPTELGVNVGDTVVQVGTPNPQTLRRFRRRVGASGRLVIVEAMPDNQERLSKAISEAGYTNVDLVRAAASSQSGQGELHVSEHWGDHKIAVKGVSIDNDLRPENTKMGTIVVDIVTLDEALPAIGVTSIDYLSITVNGAEAEVLTGARTLLRAARAGSRVFAKGHARNSAGQPINTSCAAILRDCGYRTTISRGEPSSTLDPSWQWRDGDVFAWKE